jgi:hypothetical protein
MIIYVEYPGRPPPLVINVTGRKVDGRIEEVRYISQGMP